MTIVQQSSLYGRNRFRKFSSRSFFFQFFIVLFFFSFFFLGFLLLFDENDVVVMMVGCMMSWSWLVGSCSRKRTGQSKNL